MDVVEFSYFLDSRNGWKRLTYQHLDVNDQVCVLGFGSDEPSCKVAYTGALGDGRFVNWANLMVLTFHRFQLKKRHLHGPED